LVQSYGDSTWAATDDVSQVHKNTSTDKNGKNKLNLNVKECAFGLNSKRTFK